MNFQYRLWTAREVKILDLMRSNGNSYSKIGRALGRSKVGVKLRHYRNIKPKRKDKPRVWREPPPEPDYPTMNILKADLPTMYAQGWRVQGFSGDAVQLVWPGRVVP